MDLNDLKDEILGMGLEAPQHSVLTGSLPNFVAAVEKRIGPLQRVTTNLELPLVGTFGGINIREDKRLPPNRAVLKQGDEIMAVINLD